MKWWEKEDFKYRRYRVYLTKKESRRALLLLSLHYRVGVPKFKLVSCISKSKDAAGFYEWGKIWIQLESDTVDFLTLAHEFAHYLHDLWYPEAFARLPKGREHNRTFKTLLKRVLLESTSIPGLSSIYPGIPVKGGV